MAIRCFRQFMYINCILCIYKKKGIVCILQQSFCYQYDFLFLLFDPLILNSFLDLFSETTPNNGWRVFKFSGNGTPKFSNNIGLTFGTLDNFLLIVIEPAGFILTIKYVMISLYYILSCSLFTAQDKINTCFISWVYFTATKHASNVLFHISFNSTVLFFSNSKF